ncbi:DNA polymerase V subunit UmuC [compost metagenome]
MLDLCRRGEFTEDLFSAPQAQQVDRVMQVIDGINGRWGRGTLRSAAVPAQADWAMRRALMSSSYTTQVSGLWRIR